MIIHTEEFVENGITYIRNTYDSGTIEEYIKPIPNPNPPEPPISDRELMETTALNTEYLVTLAELGGSNV